MATDPLPPRTRSARLTLVSLLLIPLLSLAVLWGFTASITLGNVIRDQQYNKVENAIAPSVIALAQTLAGERAHLARDFVHEIVQTREIGGGLL